MTYFYSSISSHLNNNLAAVVLSMWHVCVHVRDFPWRTCTCTCTRTVCVLCMRAVQCSAVWTCRTCRSWYKIFDMTALESSPKDSFYRHKTRTIWTHFAAGEINFPDKKIQGKNSGHSKLWLLLKYLFVKSNTNRLCSYAGVRTFGFTIYAWILSILGSNLYDPMPLI